MFFPQQYRVWHRSRTRSHHCRHEVPAAHPIVIGPYQSFQPGRVETGEAFSTKKTLGWSSMKSCWWLIGIPVLWIPIGSHENESGKYGIRIGWYAWNPKPPIYLSWWLNFIPISTKLWTSKWESSPRFGVTNTRKIFETRGHLDRVMDGYE